MTVSFFKPEVKMALWTTLTGALCFASTPEETIKCTMTGCRNAR